MSYKMYIYEIMSWLKVHNFALKAHYILLFI